LFKQLCNTFSILMLLCTQVFSGTTSDKATLEYKIELLTTDLEYCESKVVKPEVLSLLSECNKLEYLDGAVELVEEYITQSICAGKSENIDILVEEYSSLVEQSVTYGISDKWFYFKFLQLVIRDFTEGFQYVQEELVSLAKRNDLAIHPQNKMVALLYCISNASDEEIKKAFTIMIKELSSSDSISQNTRSYVEYCRTEGIVQLNDGNFEQALDLFNQGKRILVLQELDKLKLRRELDFYRAVCTYLINGEREQDLIEIQVLINEILDDEFGLLMSTDITNSLIRISYDFVDNDRYEIAIDYLQKCIENWDQSLAALSGCIEPLIVHPYTRDKFGMYLSVEQFKIAYPSMITETIVEHMNKRDDVQGCIEYSLKLLEYAKIMGDDNSAGETCLELSALYFGAGNKNLSRKYLSEAENYLRYLSEDEFIEFALGISYVLMKTINLVDEKYYLRKLDNILTTAIDVAIDQEYFQFQYDLNIMLADGYRLANQSRKKQYELLSRADSIATVNAVDIDRDMHEQYIALLTSDRHEYDKAREIIRDDINYYFNENDYINAYLMGVRPFSIYIFGNTYDPNDYTELINWLDRLDAALGEDEFSIAFEVDRWYAQLLYNYSRDDYESGLTIIPEYLKRKGHILELNTPLVTTSYIDLGKSLLNHASFGTDTSAFNNLLPAIENLQWEYGNDIWGDAWFIQFVDSQKGKFNEPLYLKYIERILSYPLSTLRVEEKIGYANVLLNIFGDRTESLRIYEEALQEAKQLNNQELEMEILGELAIRYIQNRQPGLAMRRYEENYNLAKNIGDDVQLSITILNMLDNGLYRDRDQYFAYSKEYYELGNKLGDYTTMLQAIGFLLHYYQSVSNYDSALVYMVAGTSLKDSVIFNVSELRYLKFVENCFTLINNDLSGSIVTPMVEYMMNGQEIQDPRIRRIYDELVYLKDYDLGSLDPALIAQYPFIYLQVLNASHRMNQFWDNHFLETSDFNRKLDFLLSLDKRNEEWGKINALWSIDKRIKDLEEYPGSNRYYGFGFRYDYSEEAGGLLIKSIEYNSPCKNLLFPGDVILLDFEGDVSQDQVIDFLKNKVYESKTATKSASSLRIVRNHVDTLEVEVKADYIQPNPYAEEPIAEISYLLNTFWEVSDNLLDSAQNLHSYEGFASTYRDFLIYYPSRFVYTNQMAFPDSEVIKILERYETISTYNFLTEAIQHKSNLRSNPLLISEYQKYSKRISEVQEEMQNSNLRPIELDVLERKRKKAYSQLEYFERYLLENNNSMDDRVTFSFDEDQSVFSDFSMVIRFCSSPYLSNGYFTWNPNSSEVVFKYSSSEKDVSTQIKIVNNLTSYSHQMQNSETRLNQELVLLTEKIFGNHLILPDEIKSKDYTWLIIPDQSTHQIPFEMLQFRFRSDSTAYHYLGEYINIDYAPSLSSFVHFSNESNRSEDVNAALIIAANPNTQEATNYASNLFALRSEMGNLKFVDDEIEKISKTFRKSKLFRKKIKVKAMNSEVTSEKAFKGLSLKDYKYIHIAAHGVHDDANPKYSGLLLGREPNGSEDGILQAHEIFPRDLNADIVTLSSCFSGFGEIDPSEGNLGIYRSFMIAGSKSVIISLWNVEDESTSILFSKFYEYLKQGDSKAKSLRKAKMYLKNETSFSHPFYWAPFVLMGES
jgi:CHAT domain-containing protein